ncbi:MAG TPA: chemotaxis protein CheW, partial [Clostridia bacterium]|nr:chemotaxis protein CheW [Clostridia bacterium]
MPETSLAEFTETTEPFEDSMRGKYLSFILSDEVYAIEIKNVKEIIGIQPITQIPELPGYMLGIINLRGKIIPIMNVRL